VTIAVLTLNSAFTSLFLTKEFAKRPITDLYASELGFTGIRGALMSLMKHEAHPHYEKR
jgi:hypothetical protein